MSLERHFSRLCTSLRIPWVTYVLVVITSIHVDRGRIHCLLRLKVFLAIIVPLRWLSLLLMIPLNRENEVVPMQSRDLTSLLHLT